MVHWQEYAKYICTRWVSYFPQGKLANKVSYLSGWTLWFQFPLHEWLIGKITVSFNLGANGSWMRGYEINGWELNEWQLILLDISLLPPRSLEVLLHHLSLQDVDVRDNEVRCVMYVNPSCNHDSPHQQQSFIIYLTSVYVTNKDRKIERKARRTTIYTMQKRSKNQFSKYWM